MRKILAIAWNDIKIEFSERLTLVFFLILPLIFTVIIGQGLQGMEGTSDENEDQRTPFLFVDQDGSQLAQILVERLEASDVIRPVGVTLEEGVSLLSDESAPALLTVPAGFEARLLDGRPVDVSLQTVQDDNRVLAVGAALQAALSDVDNAVQVAQASVSAAEAIQPFANEQDRQAYFSASLQSAYDYLSNPPTRAETSASSQAAPRIATGFEQSSPGQLVTWSLITLLGASEVFVNERLEGTLRRLLITPTRKATILLGKVTGRLSMGLAQMAILIGFGGLVLGVNWGESPAALVLLVLAFSLAAVSLGVLLGAFSTTRGQASGLTVMFSMVLAAMGGAWWPLEVTPPAYQNAVKVLPTTWAMLGFNDVIVRGLSVSEVLTEVLVLLAFAAAFFALGAWRMRYSEVL